MKKKTVPSRVPRPGPDKDKAEIESASPALPPIHGAPPAETPSYIVGIGASAGGLEALRAFFSAMPSDSGMAFIVIQHLAPDYKSLMVELLARLTEMPVVRAEEDMQVMPDHVYLITPRYNLSIASGRLHLTASPGGKTLNLPIDIFFRSLAQDAGDRAVAVILSGTGSDGARGIRAVKEAGGMVMVQAEASAKFAGMPSSAIATGTADFVLPVEEMPQQLVNFSRHPFAARQASPETHIPEGSSQLERICIRLKDAAGIDFGNYKHATLARRIERRMNIAQLQDINDYVQYLGQSTQEAGALAKDLLIGVTKFFRDGEAFLELNSQIERLFETVSKRDTLRIWSAACSTGEEAYTLAMLCENIRSQKYPRVDLKVFATDVDKSALDIASAGLYPRSVVADLPLDLLERYFVPEGADHYRIVKNLRDRLIFAKQDLMADPPFTKIDLVSCRNLLIYLRPPAQRKLLSLFHFSLIPGGLLFLGGSETLGDLSYAFETVDSKNRIFRKSPGTHLRLADTIPNLQESSTWISLTDERPHQTGLRRTQSQAAEAIQNHLLQRFAPATIVTNSHFQLLYTLGGVSGYLQIPTGPTRLDLLKMVPRDLGLAISTAGAQAMRENRLVEYRAVQFQQNNGDRSAVCVQAETFDSRSEEGQLLLITITPDLTPALDREQVQSFDLDQQLIQRVNELERELQSTRENLQASIEQQETANEELQAANEELLAANEELQSTNEELESVNEELYTVNAEYQGKILELTELNNDMENFARSTDIGAIFFDGDLCIRRFTPAFAQITGLAAQDTGRSAATFAHPVLVAILKASPKVLKTRSVHEELIEVPGSGCFLLRVIPYRQDNSTVQGIVASLVDISRIIDAEKELEMLLQTVDVGICVTDEHGRFKQVNRAYCRIYGYEPDELIGRLFTMVVPPANHVEAMRLHEEFMRNGKELPGVWEVVDKAGNLRKVGVRASLLKKNDGTRLKITVVTDMNDLESIFGAAIPTIHPR